MGISTMCGTEVALGGGLWRGSLAGWLLVRLGPWRRNVGLWAATTGQLSRRSRKARHGSAGRAWKEREASDATG
jgi:hypothetical protein